MTDRAMQALHLLGLDPIAESQADGHSYGFRLERRCADALEQSHIVLSNGRGPQWILEGDIKACFDRIRACSISCSCTLDGIALGRTRRLVHDGLRRCTISWIMLIWIMTTLDSVSRS
jgi:hypothetical protein